MRTRTRPVAKTILSLAVAVALVRAASACLDMTPIYVEPREASVVDGAPCLTCLEQPSATGGCANEVFVCKKDARCLTVYDCMVANSCLERPVFDDKIACTLPCLQDSGIFSTQDPTVDLLVSVVKCGEQGCAKACGLGDGGVGLGL